MEHTCTHERHNPGHGRYEKWDFDKFGDVVHNGQDIYSIYIGSGSEKYRPSELDCCSARPIASPIYNADNRGYSEQDKSKYHPCKGSWRHARFHFAPDILCGILYSSVFFKNDGT